MINSNVRLNYSSRRLWLLDCLVDYALPVHHFVSPHFDLRFNRPAHNLSVSEIATLIEEALRSGAVSLSADNAADEYTVAGDINRAIKAALAESPVAALWLTAQGGEEWESRVKPDWQRYIDWGDDGSTFTAETINHDLITEFGSLAEWIDPQLELGRNPENLSEVSPLVNPYWRIHERGFRFERVIEYATEEAKVARLERVANDAELQMRLSKFRAKAMTALGGSVRPSV